MLLWKILITGMTCMLFEFLHASEFIVPPNDGKIRFFRGFHTDEFYFKMKNDVSWPKNVSYVYFLNNLDDRLHNSQYLRIAVRHNLRGSTWLNINSYHSGLAASERMVKFKDKPDEDGFRGYWIRHQRHVTNQGMNRWEFGLQGEKEHPVLKIELKYSFSPRYFALEGLSTWKLKQMLYGEKLSQHGFFSSVDFLMVTIPRFFPPIADIAYPKLEKSKIRISRSSRIKSEFLEEFSGPASSANGNFSELKVFPESNPAETAISDNASTLQTNNLQKTTTFIRVQMNNIKNQNIQKFNPQIRTLSRSNDTRIEIRFTNVPLPKINISAVTLPSVTFPKSIEIPTVSFPKFELPKVTLPYIDFSNITFPWIAVSVVTPLAVPSKPSNTV